MDTRQRRVNVETFARSGPAAVKLQAELKRRDDLNMPDPSDDECIAICEEADRVATHGVGYKVDRSGAPIEDGIGSKGHESINHYNSFLGTRPRGLRESAMDNIAAGSRENFLRTQASALPTFMTTTLFSDLEMDGVNFLGINVAGLIAAVQANPGAYDPNLTSTSIGIVGPNTGSACVSQTGALSPTGWGQWCANSMTPSSSHAYLNPNFTDPEQQALFSDDQHLSAAGQQIEANFVFDELTAPLPASRHTATLRHRHRRLRAARLAQEAEGADGRLGR